MDPRLRGSITRVMPGAEGTSVGWVVLRAAGGLALSSCRVCVPVVLSAHTMYIVGVFPVACSTRGISSLPRNLLSSPRRSPPCSPARVVPRIVSQHKSPPFSHHARAQRPMAAADAFLPSATVDGPSYVPVPAVPAAPLNTFPGPPEPARDSMSRLLPPAERAPLNPTTKTETPPAYPPPLPISIDPASGALLADAADGSPHVHIRVSVAFLAQLDTYVRAPPALDAAATAQSLLRHFARAVPTPTDATDAEAARLRNELALLHGFADEERHRANRTEQLLSDFRSLAARAPSATELAPNRQHVVRVADPSPFSGNCDDLQRFKLQLGLVLARPERFIDDQHRSQYCFQLLQGEAFQTMATSSPRMAASRSPPPLTPFGS